MPIDARPAVVVDAGTAAGAAAARAIDGAVGVLVLCGTDANALGELAATLTTRTALFVGDVTTETGAATLRELLDELFAPES